VVDVFTYESAHTKIKEEQERDALNVYISNNQGETQYDKMTGEIRGNWTTMHLNKHKTILQTPDFAETLVELREARVNELIQSAQYISSVELVNIINNLADDLVDDIMTNVTKEVNVKLES